MRLPIPETFRLGPFDISVEWFRMEEIGDIGHYTPASNSIRISKELLDEQKKETFLHEIIEAIDYHYELKLEHSNIMTLAMVLAQVIRDLPKEKLNG